MLNTANRVGLLAAAAALVGTMSLAAQAPANATAKCKDGTYSTAATTKGACSDHGGVAEKITPKAKTAKAKPAAAPAATPAAAPAKTEKTEKTAKTEKTEKPAATEDKAATVARPSGAPADAEAKCKDGTYSQSKQHSGACSHHGGVSEWYK